MERRPQGEESEGLPHEKVIHLTSGTVYGGCQRIAMELTDRLPGSGWHSTLVLAGSSRDIGFPEDLECRVLPYSGEYHRPLQIRTAVRSLVRICRAVRPRLIHSHSWDTDIIAALAAPFAGIRHIAHQHMPYRWLKSRSLKHRLRRGLTRFAFTRAQTIPIAVSHDIRSQLSAGFPWLEPKLTTIHNGIDIENFRPAEYSSEDIEDGRAIRIGIASRLVPGKGLENLVEAATILASREADFEVWIAGAGKLHNSLAQLALDAKIESRIQFLGHILDMVSFYQSLDIFALPSESEGLPLGMLEAMSCGLPVVVTPVGGIREAVNHDREGLIVPVGAPEALADALHRLIHQGNERRRLGQAARSRVEREFSMGRMVSSVTALYREM